MSSPPPPQLQLDIPSNSTSFKRSFGQLGIDIEDDPSRGTSNDRDHDHDREAKRARSASVVGDGINDTTSSDEERAGPSYAGPSNGYGTTRRDSGRALAPSPPAMSLVDDEDNSMASYSGMSRNHGQSGLSSTRPHDTPPRLPTPPMLDIDMPAADVPLSEEVLRPFNSPTPTLSHPLSEEVSHRSAFDTAISALRSPASPPPVLPPLTLPTNESLTSEPPPRVDLPTNEWPALRESEIGSFHSHLSSALDFLRHDEPSTTRTAGPPGRAATHQEGSSTRQRVSDFQERAAELRERSDRAVRAHRERRLPERRRFGPSIDEHPPRLPLPHLSEPPTLPLPHINEDDRDSFMRDYEHLLRRYGVGSSGDGRRDATARDADRFDDSFHDPPPSLQLPSRRRPRSPSPPRAVAPSSVSEFLVNPNLTPLGSRPSRPELFSFDRSRRALTVANSRGVTYSGTDRPETTSRESTQAYLREIQRDLVQRLSDVDAAYPTRPAERGDREPAPSSSYTDSYPARDTSVSSSSRTHTSANFQRAPWIDGDAQRARIARMQEQRRSLLAMIAGHELELERPAGSEPRPVSYDVRRDSLGGDLRGGSRESRAISRDRRSTSRGMQVRTDSGPEDLASSSRLGSTTASDSSTAAHVRRDDDRPQDRAMNEDSARRHALARELLSSSFFPDYRPSAPAPRPLPALFGDRTTGRDLSMSSSMDSLDPESSRARAVRHVLESIRSHVSPTTTDRDNPPPLPPPDLGHPFDAAMSGPAVGPTADSAMVVDPPNIDTDVTMRDDESTEEEERLSMMGVLPSFESTSSGFQRDLSPVRPVPPVGHDTSALPPVADEGSSATLLRTGRFPRTGDEGSLSSLGRPDYLQHLHRPRGLAWETDRARALQGDDEDRQPGWRPVLMPASWDQPGPRPSAGSQPSNNDESLRLPRRLHESVSSREARLRTRQFDARDFAPGPFRSTMQRLADNSARSDNVRRQSYHVPQPPREATSAAPGTSTSLRPPSIPPLDIQGGEDVLLQRVLLESFASSRQGAPERDPGADSGGSTQRSHPSRPSVSSSRREDGSVVDDAPIPMNLTNVEEWYPDSFDSSSLADRSRRLMRQLIRNSDTASSSTVPNTRIHRSRDAQLPLRRARSPPRRPTLRSAMAASDETSRPMGASASELEDRLTGLYDRVGHTRRLHDYLTTRSRLPASRLDQPQPAPVTAPQGPSAQESDSTVEIDALRSDGRNAPRSRQLVELFRREHDGPPGMARGDRARVQRRPIRHIRDPMLDDFMSDFDFGTRISSEDFLRLPGSLGGVPRGAPPQLVQELESAQYKDWKTQDSDIHCPICLDDYNPEDPVTKLSGCSHWLHKDCLQQWLRTASTCPVCRQSLKGIERRCPRHSVAMRAPPRPMEVMRLPRPHGPESLPTNRTTLVGGSIEATSNHPRWRRLDEVPAQSTPGGASETSTAPPTRLRSAVDALRADLPPRPWARPDHRTENSALPASISRRPPPLPSSSDSLRLNRSRPAGGDQSDDRPPRRSVAATFTYDHGDLDSMTWLDTIMRSESGLPETAQGVQSTTAGATAAAPAPHTSNDAGTASSTANIRVAVSGELSSQPDDHLTQSDEQRLRPSGVVHPNQSGVNSATDVGMSSIAVDSDAAVQDRDSGAAEEPSQMVEVRSAQDEVARAVQLVSDGVERSLEDGDLPTDERDTERDANETDDSYLTRLYRRFYS